MFMKGGRDVPENTEKNENIEEIEENFEETNTEKSKKITLMDIITVQAIMCLIAAILFVGANICNSELAADIYGVYTEKNTETDGIAKSFKLLIDFLQSTPRGSA